jgi:tRNA G18 (ribose-2'-O)-methylase SpoU
MRPPIDITSIDDPRVEVFRDVRDRDLKGRGRLFMAESEMVLRRMLATPWRIHSLLLSPNKFERLRGTLAELPGHVPVYLAGVEMMTAIAGFRIHRGVLAAGVRPTADELSIDSALGAIRGRTRSALLLVEGVTNVDNMGALFRNAAAFGMDGVLLDRGCCDPLYRKAIRVSMGHVLSMPYAISSDWTSDLARLKKEWGVRLIGLELSPGARPAWEMTRQERAGLIVGGEERGLSRATLAMCDEVCEIPMARKGASLNVATAAAVGMHELKKGAC